MNLKSASTNESRNVSSADFKTPVTVTTLMDSYGSDREFGSQPTMSCMTLATSCTSRMADRLLAVQAAWLIGCWLYKQHGRSAAGCTSSMADRLLAVQAAWLIGCWLYKQHG